MNKRLSLSIFWSAMSSFIPRVLPIAAAPFLFIELGTAEMGKYAAIMALISILSQVISFGQPAHLQFKLRNQKSLKNHKIIYLALVGSALISIMLSPIIYFIGRAEVLGFSFGAPIVGAIMSSALWLSSYQIYSTQLQHTYKFSKIFLISSSFFIFFYSFIFTTLYFEILQKWERLIEIHGVVAIIFVIAIITHSKIFYIPIFEIVKCTMATMKECAALFLHSISLSLIVTFDKMIAVMIVGPEESGIYYACSMLAGVSQLLHEAKFRVLSPAVIKLMRNGEYHDAHEWVKLYFRSSILFTLLLLFICIFLVKIAFGEIPLSIMNTVIFLLLAFMVAGLRKLLVMFLLHHDMSKAVAICTILGSVIMVVSSISLSQIYGIAGLAISVLLGFVAMTILNFLYARKKPYYSIIFGGCHEVP